MGRGKLEMKKFGKVKVKNMRPKRGHMPLDEIPADCGYDKKFEFDVNMHSNGIMGDCIEWCQLNCKSKWGWWFEGPPGNNPWDHNWEEQNSYMSFENKREAMAFFLAIGIQNMGDTNK